MFPSKFSSTQQCGMMVISELFCFPRVLCSCHQGMEGLLLSRLPAARGSWAVFSDLSKEWGCGVCVLVLFF